MAIHLVYKTGGDFTPEYVARLRASLAEHAPGVPVKVLSDDPECADIPLKYNWPGWWSKMELFAQPVPWLYFDLDTIIKGNIKDLVNLSRVRGLVMLRDFHYRDRHASGVMSCASPETSNTIFNSWLRAGPKAEIKRRAFPVGNQWGDQGFIQHVIETKALSLDHWQTNFPGQIASLKFSNHVVIDSANVVCFHGKPRPHEVGWRLKGWR